MELPRHTVRILAAAMTAAIAGILLLQVLLLRTNVSLKEESFARNARAALAAAAERAEEIDLRDRFFALQGDSAGPFVVKLRKHDALVGRAAAGFHGIPGPPGPRTDSMVFVSVIADERGTLSAEVKGERLTYTIDGPRRVTVRLFDGIGRLDTTILDEVRRDGRHTLPLPPVRGGASVAFLQIRADSAVSTIRLDRGSGVWHRLETAGDARAEKIISRVAGSVSTVGGIPLGARVRPGLVDTLLREALAAGGIALPFAWAVRDLAGDSILFAGRSGAGDSEETAEVYAEMLFPAGLGGTPGELLLWFPGYRTHLLVSILPELLLTVLFVLVIAASFAWAVRMLRRQREFAGRLADFINNMTHEFKTPLSTIALSTEALARPDVAEDRGKVEMYGTIIGEEQRRMKSQVDRILEMAALEEGDVEFRSDPVDLNAIAARAAAGSALRAAARGGAVEVSLRSVRARTTGDAVHLESALNSVLDNAEKYSAGAPSIRVTTADEEDRVVVSVSDRGIGIAPEHLPNVFEKYYRVPTRNLHDVKGFGLGLSYVKLVAERHGGTVRAASVPGEGTTIEIRFPAADGR